MTAVNTTGMGLEDLINKEWIAVNHLGGFASSTVPSFNTRKYHGLLVAAMAPPVRRMVILSRVEETVIAAKKRIELANSEYPGTIHPEGFGLLRAFSPDPHPRWAYQGDGWTIEKSLRLLRGSNTVCITYTLLTGPSELKLELRPLLAMRPIHELTFQWNGRLDPEPRSTNGASYWRVPPTTRTPEVFFAHDGQQEPATGCWYLNTIYRRERERGYAGLEDLWMPGVVRWALRPGQRVHFVCSTEPIDLKRAIAQIESDDLARATAPMVPGVAGAEPDATLDLLTRAAEQFIVNTGSADASAVHVLSGLPWSPPSVRDALIGFAGLFLVTKRFVEARSFLTLLASKLNGGLIPTELSEDGSAPQYDGADTSLWFIHAVHDYLRYTGDVKALADGLLDTCAKIIERYRDGTAGLGIKCDEDGLIGSRVPGMGTTWMDAKVGDWVVTARQGRPVELNALWYSALRIVAPWCDEADQPRRASELVALADRAKQSFNRVFWHDQSSCLYDVVTDYGVDAAVRPNQLLAMSLPHPVLDASRHAAVLASVTTQLLTPLGLRTLAPGDPAYQDRYGGDVVSRDRAYHQGSVYPWLLGPYIAAMLRVRGRTLEVRREALDLLRGCLHHMEDHLGQLCELFDGDAPHRPGGAIASARNVGQLVRCYVEDVLNVAPTPPTNAATRPVTTRPPVKL
jgi:predicted glycogen debranching enzyme